MKTNDETKEHAALVRDVIAATEIKFPADDFERNLLDALYKKAFVLAPTMDAMHVRRINEAMCKMDFLSPTALALRRQTLVCLAKLHDVKKYKDAVLPVITATGREVRK